MSRETQARLFGWILSLALHGALAGTVYWSTNVPDVGFDFQLPTEVEFGLTEAVTVRPGAAPTAPSAPAASAGGPGAGAGAALDGGVPLDGGPDDAGVEDAAVDGGPPDAGRRARDAGRPRVARADPPEEPEAAEGRGAAERGAGAGDEAGDGDGVAFLPEGSQIALRIDVARIRRSPFAGDVRELLGAIPDWQAVLGDSGVEPLDDLDRLLIATPNFDRARVVMAGRVEGGREAIRAAAERLATARGEALEWRRVRGFPVADWHDRDATERVVALVGPRHFVIARPVDLPRVLAVARARAGSDEQLPADALLSMGDGEGLSLEVEGARAYYRARRGRRVPREIFPERVRLALTELPDDQVGMRSVWSYGDEDEAEQAATYFDGQRRRFANPLLLTMAGFGALFPVLDGTTIEAEGAELRADADLREVHVRNILQLGQRALGRGRRGPPGSTPPSEAPTDAPGAPEPAPAPEPPTGAALDPPAP